MEQAYSLKLIERRAYRSTLEDGIYDIVFGMVFLILALIPALKSVGIPGFYGYLPGLNAVLILWLGKRYITVPRLGSVEFGSKRKSKRLLFPIVCAVFFFLTLPLLLMVMADGVGGSLTGHVGLPAAIVLVGAPVILMAAYFLDCQRMYIYAALLCLAFPQSEFLYRFVGVPLNSLVSFGLPAAAILVYGLVLLYRFIVKYPRPSPEASHVIR